MNILSQMVRSHLSKQRLPKSNMLIDVNQRSLQHSELSLKFHRCEIEENGILMTSSFGCSRESNDGAGPVPFRNTCEYYHSFTFVHLSPPSLLNTLGVSNTGSVTNSVPQ
jgi:hypothetical protein